MSASVAYLLDTNVVSEMVKKNPDRRVAAFLASVGPSSLFLSTLTFGEIRKGIVVKQETDPAEARRFTAWASELESNFGGNTLSVDMEVAKMWGKLSADRSRPPVDTLLAATAIVHGLTFVTRKTDDVQDLPVRLLNPWLP